MVISKCMILVSFFLEMDINESFAESEAENNSSAVTLNVTQGKISYTLRYTF